MGRATLPNIDSIEEVLDLITKPAKYIAYLNEFKRIRDEAVEALGTLANKEALDVAIAKSVEDKATFEQVKKDTNAKITADAELLAVQKSEFEVYVEGTYLDIHTETASLEEKYRDLAQKYAEADKLDKETQAKWDAVEALHEQRYSELLQREEILAAAKAKIEPVAKALGVALE